MGQLKFPQEKRLEGPWLLNQEAFEELNEVVIHINNELLKAWDQAIEDQVLSETDDLDLSSEEISEKIKSTKKRHSYKRHETICELTSANDIRLVDNSIIGLLRDKSLKDLSPVKLNIRVVHGSYAENDFELRLWTRHDGELDYSINCTDPIISDDIQYQLEKWIDTYKPAKAISFWANKTEFIRMMLLVPLIMFLVFAFSPDYIKYSDILTEEAHAISETGVDDSNIHHAVDILLKSHFKYQPKDFRNETKDKDPVYYRIAILCLLLYLIVFFRPQTTIGLGKKKTQYILYSKWIQIVTVILPIAVIVTPLWNTLLTWFYNP